LELSKNHRIDELGNGYKIIQDKTKFCFGTDAVILANFASLKNINKILDIGCGNGIIPILLCEKKETLQVTGLELQKESALLAYENSKLNNLESRFKIINDDVLNIKTIFKGAKFDAVITNPPYVKLGGGILNEADPLSIARHEIKCTLEDIIANSAYVLNHKGQFFMIHRATRLSEIIFTLKKYNLEPKRIQFVHSIKPTFGEPTKKEDLINISEANMVLLEAVRGGNEFCKVLPPLILQNT